MWYDAPQMEPTKRREAVEVEQITIKGWRCPACGNKFQTEKNRKPKRCASRKCRIPFK